jgi:hypothetical protein
MLKPGIACVCPAAVSIHRHPAPGAGFPDPPDRGDRLEIHDPAGPGDRITRRYLAKQQGLIAFRRIREDFARGRLPTAAALDAVMILFAGVMLLTPGVLTDIAGLSLLFPPVRRRYREWLVQWLKSRFPFQPVPSGDGKPSVVIDSYVVDGNRSEQDDSAA